MLTKWWKRFRRSEDGSTTAETVVVLTPLLLSVFTVADLAIVYLSIESSQKAAQMAARLAVTRDAIHRGVPPTNDLVAANGRIGDPCFDADGKDACVDHTGTIWTCDGAVVPLPSDCNAAEFAIIVQEIQRLYGRVDTQDVKIEYIYRRLGRAGEEFQPEVRVTIAQHAYVSSLRTIFPFVEDIRPAVASNYSEDLSS